MIEIVKAGVTISEGDAPPLAKVFIFVMFLAMILIASVMMGKV